MSSETTIIVAGYPKSGNTWLAKMLCQIFTAKMIDDDEDHAEVNARMLNANLSKTRVIKSHLLPEDLFKKYPSENFKVFYVYRDVRDVSISAFFYFVRPGDKYLSNADGYSESVVHLKNPDDYTTGKRKIKNYILEFVMQGIKSIPHLFTWDKHIEQWQKWAANRNDIVFVSYEGLKNQTSSILEKSIADFSLKEIQTISVADAVEAENFEKLKTKFKTERNTKQFQFLRKGTSGDWKNYYTKQIGEAVNNSVGEKLQQLGYEKDITWFDKLPNEKMKPETVSEILLYLKLKLRQFIK